MIRAQLDHAAFLAQPCHEAGGIAEFVVAEGQHHAFRPGINLLNPGLPAQPLECHDLQEIIHLFGQGAEPIHQFGRHRLTFRIVLQGADAAIKPEPDRQIAHIGLRDQHRQAQPDIGRPIPRDRLLASLLRAQFRHRILQHLLVELDADLAYMPALLVTQQISGAANIQIMRGQSEARAELVQRLHHRQALFRRDRERIGRWPGEIGIAALLAAPHPAAQLVELTQAKHLGAINDQRVHRGHVEPGFDDVGGQQHVIFAIAELGHHPFQLGWRQTPMRLHRARLRHDLRQARGHAGEILNARHHTEHLAATEPLPLDCLSHHQRIKRHDEGAHRQTINRRCCDDAHLPHPRQRQLQRARDRRRRQRQHMHIRLQRFQLLLMRHAEMLFFVHNHQAEIVKRHRGRKQGMRADDDIDIPRRHPRAHFGRILGGDHARELTDLDRQTLKPLGEAPEMLTRQQGGGHHHSHLRPRHGRHKGGAQRHLGLAEADIAADQTIHWPAGGEIFENIGNRAPLVLGLDEGEAGTELVPFPLRRRQSLCLAQPAFGGGFDQRPRHVLDALLHLGLAGLPSRAAKLVNRHAAGLRAEPAQHLDIFNRQKQLLITVIENAQAIMAGMVHIQRHQTIVPPNTVILVHHQIALGDFRRLGNELICPLALARRAGDALAEQILFADQRQLLRHKAALKPQGDQTRLGQLRIPRRFPGLRHHGLEPVLGQKMGNALA